jgi:hypothetical protein
LSSIPPEDAKEYNMLADQLVSERGASAKKFRRRVLVHYMVVYQNGTREGATRKKAFDVVGMIERLQQELRDSPEYKMQEK